LEVRQNQLFEELVKIYNKRGNRTQAEQDASALIQEYQQLHPESRGGIPADFEDAGEFQLEVFRSRESKAPNPTALKAQPDLSRLVRPVVQDAVVYVKPGYKRAVVLAADNTTQEAVLQIRGSVEPAQLNFDRLCSAMPVGNYKFPGIYTQKTDLSLAQKATARAAMARNANKFSVDKYESLWPEPPKPKNLKIWDTYDSDLFLRKAVMSAEKAVGANVPDLITDAHAARMLVHVLNAYTAQQREAKLRAFWENISEVANASLNAQSTFLDLIDCLAYKLWPTKGANNLQRQYVRKMQGQDEEPVMFLSRMQSDSVVISDSMSESQCVATFIANLHDTAYVTRLQEYQQKGECETWDQARDLIDDMSRRNFASVNTPLRYWSMEPESEIRFIAGQQSTPKQSESYSLSMEERVEQLLKERPALAAIKDTLNKRCHKCLKNRDHNPEWCKLALKKNRCHVCGKTGHEGDICHDKNKPKDQWYCNISYEETLRQQPPQKTSAAPKDKSQSKEDRRIWGQLRALKDLVNDKHKYPEVVERLKEYHEAGKMTPEQEEDYQKSLAEYNNF